MYEHIGKKIKTMAKVIAGLGMLLSFLVGVVVAATMKNPGAGLLIAVFGGWGSWISCFLLYGYGQLIDNSDRIVELLSRRW